MSALVETMAYAGEIPWHGEGTPVSNNLTPQEMAEAAGVNWRVSKKPIAFLNDDGTYETVENRFALVRETDKRVFDIASGGWNPLQNEEAFAFFNDFVKNGDMEMESAGALKGGQFVWALAKVKQSFTILKKDQIDAYLLFTNPHKVGHALDVRFTPVRVVCWNTLSLALNRDTKNQVSVAHNQKFDPEEVKRTLGISSQILADYKERAEFLAKQRANKEDVVTYFKRVFDIKEGNQDTPAGKAVAERARKQIEHLKQLLHTQPGAEFGAGTWWQAFNTVTVHVDHHAGNDPNSRLFSAWYGQGADRKNRALKLALEMASAS